MIKIFENYPLDSLNCFNVKARAQYYCPLNNKNDLSELMTTPKFRENKKLILGGGSNILFTADYSGICVHPEMDNIKLIKENNNHSFIEVESGYDWDKFVEYTISKNLSGLENLSYIPGTVGASPVQNIGAYGVEIKDFVEGVNVVDLNTGEYFSLSNTECEFEYRNSKFKKDNTNRYLILSVIFRLNRYPKLNLEYSGIVEKLKNTTKPSVSDVREAIRELRNEKLPDHKILGTAGSFFKNPIIKVNVLESLLNSYKLLKFFELPDGEAKISAAWLIEECGWKGKQIKDAGVYENQALVLVNHGNASGKEILELSEKIRESVFSRFGIQLKPEVTIIK